MAERHPEEWRASGQDVEARCDSRRGPNRVAMQRVSIGQSREETMLVDPSQVPPRSLEPVTVLSSIILENASASRSSLSSRLPKIWRDGSEGQVFRMRVHMLLASVVLMQSH